MNEFDGFVLAAIREGAHSGYAIRLRLDAFGVPRWSSESGSSYRVLRRLESQNLVRISGKAGVPNRQRTEYVLTQQGEQAFLDWMVSGPFEVIDGMSDITTYRAEFLPQIPLPQRKNIIKGWLRATQHLVRALKARDGKGEFAERMVLANYLEHTKARERWLKMLLKEVTKIP